MNLSINFQRLIPLFLVCFCIALIPSLFAYYLLILAIGTKVFVITCIVDYFRKTTIRKNFGLVLSVMILAFIISLVVLCFVNSANYNSIYAGLVK